MRRVGVIVAAVLLAGAATASAIASGSAPAAKPIQARAFVAIDAETGRVLLARRPGERRPIASLTKMMTGLLVAERGALDEKVRVASEATWVEDYREGLVAGKRYKRRTLLLSTLLVSGNDSATALGIDAGGGSLSRFYAQMNERARALGMNDTTYASASGLDDTRNLSTALDQAMLARAALTNPTFAKIVSTQRTVVRWAAPTIAKEWINHNKMLVTYRGTYGVKTGWTTRAGGCLAVAVRRGDRSVIAVLLHSKGIWDDMPRLVDAAFAKLDRG